MTKERRRKLERELSNEGVLDPAAMMTMIKVGELRALLQMDERVEMALEQADKVTLDRGYHPFIQQGYYQMANMLRGANVRD